MKSILNRITIGKKLGLVVVPLLIPSIVLLFMLVTEKNIAIEFSEKELKGIRYLNSMKKFISNLQRHNTATTKVTPGPESENDELKELEAVISDALEELRKLDHEIGAELYTTGKTESLIAGWNTLKVSSKGSAKLTNFDNHSNLLREALGIFSIVVDQSNLILDPDIDSYYNMDILVLRIPELIDQISLIRRISIELDRNDKISELQKNNITNSVTVIRKVLQGADKSLRKAIDFNPDLNLMEAKIKDEFLNIENYLKFIETEIINQNNSRISASVYLENSAKAVDSYYRLFDEVSPLLENLLRKRVDTFIRNKYQAMVFVASAISIILFLVLSISKSISTPVTEMTRQIKECLGEGNIGYRFPDIYLNEFGDQSVCFNEFLEQLGFIVKNLISVATELSGIVGTVTNSSEKLSFVAQEHAAGLEESSASLEELSGSINSVAKSVALENENILSIDRNTSDLNSSIQGVNVSLRRLNNAAEKSALSGEHGKEKIKLATVAMEEITKTAFEINSIVSLITEISDQTNLLSLNASIESARAGELGRGFAVVAQEVSKLSDRTVLSVKEINSLIGKSYKAIESGTKYIEETISVFNDNIYNINEISGFINTIVTDMIAQEKNIRTISANIGEIVNLSSQVYNATEEQLTASDVINGMVQKLNVGTQTVADNAQSMVGTAMELQRASSNIENVLIKFKL